MPKTRGGMRVCRAGTEEARREFNVPGAAIWQLDLDLLNGLGLDAETLKIGSVCIRSNDPPRCIVSSAQYILVMHESLTGTHI